jgi:hypothetical protein
VREVTARTGPRGYVGKHLCFLPACVALSMDAIDTVPTLENARRWLRLMHIGPALERPSRAIQLARQANSLDRNVHRIPYGSNSRDLVGVNVM